jgi:asparagine synthase (glutamine-hydrolysing)
VPRLRAYCSAFEELSECDERHISGPLAEHYGIPVTDVPADDAWPLKEYPAHGPDRDDPFIGVYHLLVERSFAVARAEGIGTVLSGERGDEVVGDWVWDVSGLLLAGRWRTLWAEYHAYRRDIGSSRRFLARELVPAVGRAFGPARTPRERRPAWLAQGLADRVGLATILDHPQFSGTFAGARNGRYGRIFWWGGARTAVWNDRTAARLGVSWADPWSDRRLAEFVLGIPQHLVNLVAQPKRLARRAMRTIIPAAVLDSTRKIIPDGLFERGFKDREASTVLALLSNSVAEEYGFIDAAVLRGQFERYLVGGTVHHDFWWPLTLEAWLRGYWGAAS